MCSVGKHKEACAALESMGSVGKHEEARSSLTKAPRKQALPKKATTEVCAYTQPRRNHTQIMCVGDMRTELQRTRKHTCKLSVAKPKASLLLRSMSASNSAARFFCSRRSMPARMPRPNRSVASACTHTHTPRASVRARCNCEGRQLRPLTSAHCGVQQWGRQAHKSPERITRNKRHAPKQHFPHTRTHLNHTYAHKRRLTHMQPRRGAHHAGWRTAGSGPCWCPHPRPSRS